jgi:formylglycine-generating enzyme required for sulfatase activity
VDQCKSSDGTSVRWDRTSDGYRLPTEAEWEYAARAGSHRLFAGAESYEQVCKVGNVADLGANARFDWSDDGSTQCTDAHPGLSPAGAYEANAWGLHDMTGNVYEWCWDIYGDYSGTSTDPVGAQSGVRRVDRGGSWGSDPRHARVALRGWDTPGNIGRDLGLRLVRTNT